VDPSLPLYEVSTAGEILRRSIWEARLYGWLFGSFAAIALLLAAVDVYGVMASMIAGRTQEIGVRMALGARTAEILRLVLRRGMTLAATGLVLGLLGAFAVTRLMASLLFGVSETDPLTFGVVTLLLAGSALLAAYLPARRATRVDPVVALRAE
jgi:ABC-type antimicrobial peptide transport system permease subunit